MGRLERRGNWALFSRGHGQACIIEAEAQRKLVSQRKVVIEEVTRLMKERTELKGFVVKALGPS